MTTTEIIFNEKQSFGKIKEVIKSNFENFKIHQLTNGIYYFFFYFKNETIFCHFMKHNQIYGRNNEIKRCSTLSSDRPNDNKFESFKIIASNFKCKLWFNDCDEKNFIEFNKA